MIIRRHPAAILTAILAMALALGLGGAGMASAFSGTTTVSGVLKAPDGNPLGEYDGYIEVYQSGPEGFQWYTSAANGPDGAWSVEVTPGVYRFGGGGYEYGDRYYVDAPDLDSADDVTVAETAVTGIDITLETLPNLTGQVVSGSTPLDKASVTVFFQGGQPPGPSGPRSAQPPVPVDQWWVYGSYPTKPDGTFAIPLPPGTYLVRAGKKGYASMWAGGDSEQTATRFTVDAADVVAGVIDLPVRTSQWGKVAGEKLSYCTSNTYDPSASEVSLPFGLQFYGKPFATTFINENGTLSFGDGDYSPEPIDLKFADKPLIAAFMARIDTLGPGSAEVTYGSSPDGKTFCVLWDGVGYPYARDDKLNTFQLLLTDASGKPGRSAGDFDITLNYDDVQWDTFTDFELGTRGASVGYSGGVGVPGTYMTLPGSMVEGAFKNGGPNALVANSANTTQAGRYVYEIRNDTKIKFGSASGTVTDTLDAPVAGSWVSACLDGEALCQYGTTGVDGSFSFASMAPGTYSLNVSPPAESPLNPGFATFTVAAEANTAIPTIKLTGPTPPPPGTTITSIGTTPSGQPVVYWNSDLALTATGCAGGLATYQAVQAGTVVRTGALTEGPDAGQYFGTIPKFYPTHGLVAIIINIACPGGGTEDQNFDVYIDPSGTVVDQYGPVSGATVTLSRSDTEGGAYTDVPDGDAIMSPSNRTNPGLTTDQGLFGWDVIPGWYKVTATKPGCTPASTAELPVPPPQLNLQITMSCDPPKPSSAPRITGTGQVGQTLTLEPGTWPSGIEVVERHWLRDGTKIDGATGNAYQVTDADAGKSLSVRLKLQRTGYTAFFADTAAVKVQATPTPTPDRKAQKVSGKVPTKVKVKKTAKLPKTTDASQKVSWKTLTKKTCKVSKGKVKGVKKGTCKVQASAPETSAYLPLKQTFKLKVKG